MPESVLVNKRDLLIEQYRVSAIKLAYSNRFIPKKHNEIEDCIGDALLELVASAEEYIATGCTNDFWEFARPRILLAHKRTLQRELQRRERHAEISLDHPLSSDHSQSRVLKDVLAADPVIPILDPVRDKPGRLQRYKLLTVAGAMSTGNSIYVPCLADESPASCCSRVGALVRSRHGRFRWRVTRNGDGVVVRKVGLWPVRWDLFQKRIASLRGDNIASD